MLLFTNGDGVSHINVYSKGKTELGRLLSNFAHTPFTYEPYGRFESVEGFWYYYLTGCQHEILKSVYGSHAKDVGKCFNKDRIDWVAGAKETPILTKEHKDIILEAIRCKLRQNRFLLEMLIESTLPLKHYYVYGDSIKLVPEYDWMIDEIERIRKVCHEHKEHYDNYE